MKFIVIEGKLKNLFGSLHIIKVKEDVNRTKIVEFTQLVTNTTEALALNYETQIIQKMENFTMKPTFGIAGCAVRNDLTAFETIQFLDRNILRAMTLEWVDSFSVTTTDDYIYLFFFLPTKGTHSIQHYARFFEKSHFSRPLPVLISNEINFENTKPIFEWNRLVFNNDLSITQQD